MSQNLQCKYKNLSITQIPTDNPHVFGDDAYHLHVAGVRVVVGDRPLERAEVAVEHLGTSWIFVLTLAICFLNYLI